MLSVNCYTPFSGGIRMKHYHFKVEFQQYKMLYEDVVLGGSRDQSVFNKGWGEAFHDLVSLI